MDDHGPGSGLARFPDQAGRAFAVLEDDHIETFPGQQVRKRPFETVQDAPENQPGQFGQSGGMVHDLDPADAGIDFRYGLAFGPGRIKKGDIAIQGGEGIDVCPCPIHSPAEAGEVVVGDDQHAHFSKVFSPT